MRSLLGRLSTALLCLVVLSLVAPPTPPAVAGQQAHAAKPRLVVYPEPGEIVRLGDSTKLAETSAAFRAFVQARLRDLGPADAECANEPWVSVDMWRSDGYAVGDEGKCGGARYVWVKRGRSWRAAVGSQEPLRCGYIRAFGIPKRFTGAGCYDDAGNETTVGRYRWKRKGFAKKRVAMQRLVDAVMWGSLDSWWPYAKNSVTRALLEVPRQRSSELSLVSCKRTCRLAETYPEVGTVFWTVRLRRDRHGFWKATSAKLHAPGGLGD